MFTWIAGLALASAHAQTASNNAVFNGAGTAVTFSSAVIDASAFASTSTTICETIYSILNGTSGYGTYPATGAIIDARGLTTSNSNFTCKNTIAESPWQSGTSYLDKPSVILLPAGTITISYTWLLPNNTRIIGQGASTPVGSGTTQTGTVLAAAANFSGPGSSISPVLAMVQFGEPSGADTCKGSPSGICFNISIEDVTLSNAIINGSTITAANANIDGILNLDSQELTYARRVNLYGITETGLQIGYTNYAFQAQNSGPYEGISYNVPTGITGVYCAQIYGAGTRGIHGIKCNGNSGTAGILVDTASDSIEDVYVNGFTDGILVGSQSSTVSRAWGNLLSNISGGTAVTNLVHLCGSSASGNCPASPTALPRGITILGATSGTTGSSTYTILDGVTGAMLSTSTDASVGIYALGEPVSTGNSRFTTSPSVPAWFFGTTQSPSSTCSNGSIYTSTSGSASGGTLWGCIASGWVMEK